METILILHGWGSRAQNWSRVKELLENQGYRVLIPDMPGFGNNPPPPRPWTVNDYFEWVKDFCDKNSLSQFFLLGHSFGGGLAVKFASLFPKRVKKLILVAPKIRRHKTYQYYLGMILARLGNIVFYIPPFSSLQPLAKKVLYRVLGVYDYRKLDMQKAVMMKETFKQVVGEDLVGYLSAITSSTLIVWGKSDNMTPLKDAALINQAVRGSVLDVIEKGEHFLNLQMPDILAQKIVNFIKL